MTYIRPTRRQLVAGAAAAGLIPLSGRPAMANENIRLRALYEKDQSFTPMAQELEGESVKVEGFMAPPLEANSDFFVLTKKPMAVCPFCETEAEWPDDILGVYTRRIYTAVPFNRGIVVTGELSLGTYTDPDTGFLSRVRLENARFDYA